MANELLVTKITLQSMTNGVVDWIYGDDSKSMGGSTILDLSSLSLANRSSTEHVTELLNTQLNSTTLNSELAASESRPPTE
tara:strand:- start:76 stop:318 length:243 start_codon:yes stop_codon:yes gene_type:complete